VVDLRENGMHGLIRERLEEYLRGAAGRKVPPEFERHLRDCETCREEVSGMREQAQLLHTLSPAEEMDPAAGFYARVVERIEAQQEASFWNAFLDPVFGRRLVATSLTLAVLLGGFLAYSEARRAAPEPAEAIMAVQDHPPGLGENQQQDRDTILVTLATYRE
jgi:anti-sigma factor RsiW